MIRVLDPTVAAQIAAGEVVERPASVVKELVENAIDAGARRITVEVRGGGITELKIQDDGSGIMPDEVELAFQRHATSKLQNADDLFAIGTLGFRGEALPSIASIAQVTCITRVASEPVGVELRIAGGELQSRNSVGASPGTTFIIRNLFYNIPVRREFLRSAGHESAAVSAVMTHYALAYPQIRFNMLVDGRLRLQTSGSGHLPDVLLSVYGLEVARAMLPLEFSDGGNFTGITVRGLVSPPTMSRSSRDAIHITVNGRAVQPKGQIAGILDDAYHTLLMKGRFPYIVLAIEVHPGAVDVNVHPTKSEVKFRDNERVRSVIARAIRSLVQGTVVMQGWEGATITPVVDPDAEPDWADDTAPLNDNAVDLVEKENTVAEATPVPDAQPSPGASHEQADLPPEPARALRELPTRFPPLPPQREQPEPFVRPPLPSAPRPPAPVAVRTPEPVLSQESIPDTIAPVQEPVIQPTESASPQPKATPGLPRLRALAQLARMYLLAEGPDGDLYLIDQHAAHERITYERLMAQRGAGAVESQRLLMPQTIVLPPATQATLLDATAEMATWGFELEEAQNGVYVRAMPTSVALEELKSALLEVADHLSGAGGSTPEAWREQVLITLSCHTSIRTGHPLTPAEQQALIDQLGQCRGGRTCPHGRPTVIVVTKQQLTRQFGRLG